MTNYRKQLQERNEKRALARVNSSRTNTMAAVRNDRPMPNRENDMVKASSGQHYVFKVSDLDYLKRFLITGTTGSMYISNGNQFRQHIDFLEQFSEQNIEVALQAVELMENISLKGRAVKNDPALFALAVFTTSPFIAVRQRAFLAVPKMVRTGTHLFTFMSFLREMRGFGRGLRRSINNWYLSRNPQSLSYQVAKYRHRVGWSHRDVLRLTRPKASLMDAEQRAIIDYAVHATHPLPDKRAAAIEVGSAVSPVIAAYEEMKTLGNTSEAKIRGLSLINLHGLPHEVVPDDWKKDPLIWETLLPNMNPEALLRNLGRMTGLGIFTNNNSAQNVSFVDNTFSEERIQSARLHPLKIYIAMKAYEFGTSTGGLTWTAHRGIQTILENAFYSSFKYAPATGKDIYIGLDVSGSMGAKCYQSGRGSSGYGYNDHWTPIVPGSVSCYEASAIMTRAITSVERRFHVGAFSHSIVDATDVFRCPEDTIKQTVQKIERISMGSTDLSLPFADAIRQNRAYDAFVIFTDSEVNHYGGHPAKLVADYRERVGKATRFIVVGMTANRISIADPKDPYMLDIGGFDGSIPKLISEFLVD